MSVAEQSEESEGQASMSLELQLHILREMLRLIDRGLAMLDAGTEALTCPNFCALETAIADLKELWEQAVGDE